MRNALNIVVSMALLSYALGASGQNSGPRAGQWEFTLQPQYVDSTSISGDSGSSANIAGDWGFGLGFAYNISNHLAVGGELTWNEADYKARIVPGVGNPGSAFDVAGTMTTSTLRVNGTWNFLATSFTPFVTGGIGATYVDTNIPNGPTQCWVDPWWGTYCGTPTKSNTYFSYNAGAGLRWDVNRSFFLRGVYTRQWLDVGGGVGSPGFDQYRIDFGFKH